MAGEVGVDCCASAIHGLAGHRRQRLADALFMQTTAMHLFQMHSALPSDSLSTHIFRDRLLADELRNCCAVPCNASVASSLSPGPQPRRPPGSVSDLQPSAEDPTQGWCQDYRTILKLSTVCTPSSM